MCVVLVCSSGLLSWSNSDPVSYLCPQKYEKPKFVQCLAFLSTGDILTGDSGGVLLVWTRSSAETPTGKGPRGQWRGCWSVLVLKFFIKIIL